MQVSVEVPVEAFLKGSAAKVLLHLLRRGGVPGTNAEMMRGSGVHDRNTYYIARGQLRDLGLWENPGRFFQQVVGNTQQGEGKYPADAGKYPAPLLESPAPRIRAALEGVVVHEQTLRERAMLADVNNDEHEQVEVLLAAWKEMFPRDTYANRVNIKKLLELARGSAEDLIDQFEQVKARNIAHPFGYIQATLRQVAAVAPQVKPAVIGKPTRAEETGDYLMDTPSERSRIAMEKLRAAGLLDDDEDD